ncbi:hypothetical protein CYMTET_22733 [Cymbomonas tetramitiformis]|uniref:Argininosuccinate lyase n=1 Tax=Cymbomonas tetramitiformis TaxID=36881 RepID=A0AAE0FZ96_9CHLO|nr:hypothetical protein CYMTET_22733 [Cymbomonas tetramitiformis]|eukprot:gene18039-21484_t
MANADKKTDGGGYDSGGAMWGGRFEEAVSSVVERFGESVSFDKKLYRQDLRGSRAHATMLQAQGLITEDECKAIVSGLAEVESEIEAGTFNWRADREDVHMNVESVLIDKIGEAGKKLHTARSRNDQVVTDVRMWVREAIDEVRAKLRATQVALYDLAAANEGVVVPGYTHLQRAQPLLLQHSLLAYVEQLERDRERLLDCRKRVNLCPLGACALAGTGLNIDRHATSEALGFSEPLANSVDAVSDRDFLLEYVSCLSILAMHTSRLAEEWVLWTSEEFKFMLMGDSVSTGSSIMPQKKNPDPMELTRGKTARVYGALMTLLTLCKGLPQAYNRDLQEDKEPLFDSTETTIMVLEVVAEFARNVTFNTEHINKGLGAGFLDATTLADYLVRKGMAFRSAHEVVGKCVALGESKNCELKDLSLEELQGINNIFTGDVYESLGVQNSVNQFQSYGSTGAKCVEQQMQRWGDEFKKGKGKRKQCD